MQTKIKICGIKSEKDVDIVNQYCPDFIGMVLFFPDSKRNISITMAQRLLKKLDCSIITTAVVVSPTIEQIKAVETAGFDYIQIHGELQKDIYDAITIPILKAFNGNDLECYSSYQRMDKIKGYVFDAAVPGSGKTFDWKILNSMPRDNKMHILAGGLDVDNVLAGIKATWPDMVDVSSSIELADGTGKDETKVREFIRRIQDEQ